MLFLKSSEYFLWLIRKIAVKHIPVFILILYSVNCTGNSLNDISSKHDKALFEILNLNTVSATRILDNEYHPGSVEVNMYLECLNNQKNVIEIVLFEDQARYEKYLQSLDSRLDFIDKNADKSTPSFGILLGEMYALAGLTQMFYKDYFSGFIKIIRANNYARENQKKYPDCWLNNKLCGVLNVSLDQLSPFLKGMAGLFNLNGNSETGFKQLRAYLSYVKDYPGMKNEALLFNGFALRMSKNDEKAYTLFKEEVDSSSVTVLTRLLYSSILHQTGRNEQARKILSGIDQKKFEIPFPFMDYIYGRTILYSLDKDAEIYLKRFLMNSQSKNYKKEICSRLSDFYLIQSNTNQFIYYRNKIGTFPKATTERDREADVESKRPYNPDPLLLKARYLVNGGYYAETSELLKSVNPAEFNQAAYKNEYLLLMARVKSGTDKLTEAVEFCDQAVTSGMDCPEHYAAEAALLAGDIMLKKGNRVKAESYFKLALAIKGQNDVYIENIHKMANNRLKNI